MSDSDNPSFATAGSGKSDAEVAFELVSKLKGQGVWGERNIEPILNMYAECLDAVRGLRPYPGQNRVDAPIQAKSPAAQPAAHSGASMQTTQAPAQPPAQPQAQAQQQARAPQQVAQQGIQAQQQVLQQAFKTG